MKNKFAFTVDVIFVAIITFMLSLVFFNYFIPYPYTIVFSVCLSALATILFFSRSDKRNKLERLKRAERKECEELTSELNFSSRKEQLAIIQKALENAGKAVEYKRGALQVANALIILKFGFDKVNKTDVVKAFNLINKEQKAYILASEFDNDILAFAQRFNGRVNLIDGKAVYKYLKDKCAIPEYKYKCFTEIKLKGSLKNLLDKRKSKTFLAFGTIFLLMSYISPLKAYYIVCGCLFLIYSLILRLLGKDLTTQKING